jgi:O-antigen ligase
LLLIAQAMEMIKDFPLFGVGLNHFTISMALHELTPEARGFLYPVHNTVLLFISELGIPAGLLFIIFVVQVFQNSWRISQKTWTKFGIWAGASTFLINSQFHTLFNQDPSFDMFIVMLAYLTTL